MFLNPDYNLDSIYEINLEELKLQGIKGLLFDLDSTLMASKSAKYDEKTLNWLNEVHKDFFIAIVSNNHNPSYIEKVKRISNFPTLFEAEKPKTKKVLEFLHEYGVASCECALVGDRPLTDILCGKRLGCKTILVDSITASSEAKIVRFVRWLERLTIRK
jgi:hypothetical protein